MPKPLTDSSFGDEIASFYDSNLVPLIFEPYAQDLARRIQALRPYAAPPTATLNYAPTFRRPMAMKPKAMTIGKVAGEVGVPASTIRYYERAGLLLPSARSGAGYRLYSQDDLARLRFIRAAQATGFTLKDIQELLRAAPCGDVQALIEARLGQVRKRIAELRHLDRVLGRSLEACREHEASGRCGVIEALGAQTGPDSSS